MKRFTKTFLFSLSLSLSLSISLSSSNTRQRKFDRTTPLYIDGAILFSFIAANRNYGYRKTNACARNVSFRRIKKERERERRKKKEKKRPVVTDSSYSPLPPFYSTARLNRNNHQFAKTRDPSNTCPLFPLHFIRFHACANRRPSLPPLLMRWKRGGNGRTACFIQNTELESLPFRALLSAPSPLR